MLICRGTPNLCVEASTLCKALVSWSRKGNLITSNVFILKGPFIYNSQIHAWWWQGHYMLMYPLHLYTYFLVLLSSLPPGGLDCPVPTVTPQLPLCGAETRRANLCAMLVDSTWNCMGCATYSAHAYMRLLSCLYMVSVKKKTSKGEGIKVKSLIINMQAIESRMLLIIIWTYLTYQ